MTYKLSQEADSDLYALYIEGIEEHGIVQADKYYDELIGALDLLGRHPEMARIRFEIDPPVRVHPHKEHIIIYDIEDDGDVFIVRVRNRREDWVSVPN